MEPCPFGKSWLEHNDKRHFRMKGISCLYIEFQRHRGRDLRSEEGWNMESIKEIHRSFRKENLGDEKGPASLRSLVVTELYRVKSVQRAARKIMPLRLWMLVDREEWCLARNIQECLESGNFFHTVREAEGLGEGCSFGPYANLLQPSAEILISKEKLGWLHSNFISVCQPHPSFILFQDHSQNHSESSSCYTILIIYFICHYPLNSLKLPLAKDLEPMLKTKKLKNKTNKSCY